MRRPQVHYSTRRGHFGFSHRCCSGTSIYHLLWRRYDGERHAPRSRAASLGTDISLPARGRTAQPQLGARLAARRRSNEGRKWEAPMARWMSVAALLVAMTAALPAWAGDAEDCQTAQTLVKTEPARVVAACRRLAEQGETFAQT